MTTLPIMSPDLVGGSSATATAEAAAKAVKTTASLII
jgi:hypothetical protein